MFTWVGSRFEAVLNTYILDVVQALMQGLAPIALIGMTLWIGLYGWAVLRNEVPETVPVFVWKVFKVSLVLVFALQSSIYIDNVADTANALAVGVASTFLPSGVDPATITTPYALIDRFNDAANTQVADIMKEASLLRLDLVLSAVVFSIGTVTFLCIALFVVTLSKLLLTFVIGIGPIFILTLAWRPTARFFDSWLSMMLNAVVMTWFSFFALGLSIFMGDAIFKAIVDGGGFLGTTLNVLSESMRYCVLMILLAILCFQAPSLASALTGGAVVQQGVQMIQNAMMVAGLRSAASQRAGGAAQGPGGSIRGGVGPAYGAGHAAGSVVRQGREVARLAAYQLAALRGRDRQR
jgi:type IV secretion system protein VirB6